MTPEVRAWFERTLQSIEVQEPICEFGSLQVQTAAMSDLRRLVPGKEYVGCDIVDGPGVDRKEDLHSLTFEDDSFGTIFLAETMEHVRTPWKAIEEVHRVLKPGGYLFWSTPFLHPIHHEPDYWRYTPAGVERLLENFAEVKTDWQLLVDRDPRGLKRSWLRHILRSYPRVYFLMNKQRRAPSHVFALARK